jgi:hypothetical protein
MGATTPDDVVNFFEFLISCLSLRIETSSSFDEAEIFIVRSRIKTCDLFYSVESSDVVNQFLQLHCTCMSISCRQVFLRLESLAT